MKKLLLIFSLLLCNALASDISLQKRELTKKEMKSQNKRIVQLASLEMSKSLPQKIDKYTKLISIKAQGSTLIYIYEINTGAKSDTSVIKEDHSRMKEAVTRGTCKSSKKFLEADISLAYIYKSYKTKVKLFRFDVNKESCFRL
ncbi:MAG: hypothetical protein COB17_04575 [Sulfurimonas sp.]|nr:MAG: hypothetical protein COB17_04575 [Sulfurimonas sp.]